MKWAGSLSILFSESYIEGVIMSTSYTRVRTKLNWVAILEVST